jgi:hypothetical protein
MWSPKKIDFPFYDFCMIYYNFSKFIQNKHKRKGGNPLRKNYPGRSYVRLREFEAKYPIFKFKIET